MDLSPVGLLDGLLVDAIKNRILRMPAGWPFATRIAQEATA